MTVAIVFRLGKLKHSIGKEQNDVKSVRQRVRPSDMAIHNYRIDLAQAVFLRHRGLQCIRAIDRYFYIPNGAAKKNRGKARFLLVDVKAASSV